jgi:tRNA-2-methylthio-N6-dimethylallyladenosine synthase
VLFEKHGLRAGQAVGRSPWLQPVHAERAAHLIGAIEDVRIVDVLPNSLKGEVVAAECSSAMVTH